MSYLLRSQLLFSANRWAPQKLTEFNSGDANFYVKTKTSVTDQLLCGFTLFNSSWASKSLICNVSDNPIYFSQAIILNFALAKYQPISISDIYTWVCDFIYGDLRSLVSTSKMQVDIQACLNKLSQSYNPQVITQLRKIAIKQGIPEQFRPTLWKIFLRCKNISAETYRKMLQKGPSEDAQVILKDTKRTFASDPSFQKRVSEDRLIRILNATLHYRGCRYVQGMNTLLGPLTYVLSELDAFFCFQQMLDQLPSYIILHLDGVHIGCAIVDKIIHRIDPELAQSLKQHGATSGAHYIFKDIMTLRAATPDLNRCIRYWDALFSIGLCYNVIFEVASMLALRKDIIQQKQLSMVLEVHKQYVTIEDQIQIIMSKIKPILSDNVLMNEIVAHPKQRMEQ